MLRLWRTLETSLRKTALLAASGVVLIQGTLSMYKEGHPVQYCTASLPVMLITVIFTFVQVFLFDRKVKKAGVRRD